jgi:uncharacterized protein with FMN-binding domain
MDTIEAAQKKKVQAGLALLLLSTVIVGTAIAAPSKAMVTTPATASPTSQPTGGGGTTTTASSYKDGSYSATGTYFSPGGQEALKVSVTLKSDVVTATSIESGANDPTATSYQASFIGGYKNFVVGKRIDALKLTNVSGSSLTSQGFNNAIKQIEKQAQA